MPAARPGPAAGGCRGPGRIFRLEVLALVADVHVRVRSDDPHDAVLLDCAFALDYPIGAGGHHGPGHDLGALAGNDNDPRWRAGGDGLDDPEGQGMRRPICRRSHPWPICRTRERRRRRTCPGPGKRPRASDSGTGSAAVETGKPAITFSASSKLSMGLVAMEPFVGFYQKNRFFLHRFSFPVGEAGMFPARPFRFISLAGLWALAYELGEIQ